MDYGVLGALRLDDAEAELPAKQARLLAALVVQAGKPVNRDALIEAIWAVEPPVTAGSALQVYVSRLRARLGGERLTTRGTSYCLELLEGDTVDALRFHSAVDVATSGARGRGAASVARLLREALALWRGTPVPELHDWLDAAPYIAELEETRLIALENLAAADLELGRQQTVVAQLGPLLVEHPTREGLHVLQARALYRDGRQTDALSTLRTLRDRLDEDFGLEPGEAVSRLELLILRQDPSLLETTASPATAVLPIALNEFLGREPEIEALHALLQEPGTRMVTMVGPGGVGKTRLALEACRELVTDSGRAVGVVELASIREAEQVLPAVCRSLEIPTFPDEPVLATLQRALDGQPMLLVLDNCEQVVSAAPTLAALLTRTPTLQLLATSRSPLRIAPERLFPVAPLPVVVDDGEEHSAGVRLFVARAQAIRPGLRWSDDNLRAAAAIAAAVDGLPLAIELAAGRSNVLSPVALAARLREHGGRLGYGSRDMPERHQSMHNTIAWSYDLLSVGHRSILDAVSVFSGGFRLDAAAAVLDPRDDLELLEALSALVDVSLVLQRDDADGEPRFDLLQTVREFALERLASQGLAREVNDRHLEWVSRLVRDAEPVLRSLEGGPHRRRLEDELDNIRAACAHAIGCGRSADAADIVAGLRRFWYMRGHIREGIQWAESLAADRTLTARHRGRLLLTVGQLRLAHGDYIEASVAAQEGLLASQGADLETEASCLGILANCAYLEGDLSLTEEIWQRQSVVHQANGNERGLALTLGDRGMVALQRGDFEAARTICTAAVSRSEELGLDDAVTVALLNLGWAHLGLREPATAARMLKQALHRDLAADEPRGLAYDLVAIAALALEIEAVDPAVRLASSGARLLDAAGGKLETFELTVFERTFSACRQRVGDEAVSRWERAARDMTRDALVALAGDVIDRASARTDRVADSVP